jgi:L-alanine-DL-glutamate epimerase-like enolase superfamily enzyme
MPGGVAADAHWSWSTFTEARRACRELDELGLSFIEDPFDGETPAAQMGCRERIQMICDGRS